MRDVRIILVVLGAGLIVVSIAIICMIEVQLLIIPIVSLLFGLLLIVIGVTARF